MADSVITINTQKFRKVKGVWVDQTKTPAPKDLIALLDKLSAAEAAAAGPGEAKESKPALPVLPIAAKDFSTAKLESSINRLAKVVEKLSKTIEKSESKKQSSKDQSAKQDTDDTDVPASPAQRISEPGKIPTLREAMKLNTKEFFKGTTNKYGEKESPGLLRTLAQRVLPVTTPFFAAKDRQRAAIGNELREYEGSLQSNPNLSKKQINQKIVEKRKEFLDSKNFKSYEELKAKLNTVLGLTPSATPSASPASRADRVVLPEASAPNFKAKEATEEVPWKTEDEDEDLSYFDKLKALANED